MGIATLLSFSLFAQQLANQEKDQLYVTDQLRLSLYSEANSQSKVVKLLSSGDMLEVDELSGAYAFVTAPGNVKGWVKRGFLVSKPTSNLLLAEEIEKNEELQSEIDKLGNSKIIIDQYEKDMEVITAKMDQIEDERDQAIQSKAELIEQLSLQVEEQQRQQAENEMEINASQGVGPPLMVLWKNLQSHWRVIAPLLLVIILISFLLTKMIVEARIKRKFHGIKIW